MNHPSENPHSSRTFIPTPHFLRTLLPNVLYSQRKLSRMYQLAEFTRSGLFSFEKNSNIFNLFSYMNQPSGNPHSSRTFIPTPHFLRALSPNIPYSQRKLSPMYQFAVFTRSGLFSYGKNSNIFNLFSYMNHPSENPHLSRTSIPTPHFLRALLPNVLYSQRKLSQMYQLAEFTRSGLFSYQPTGTNRNGINYLHLPSDRERMATPSISSKSNLLELFSQATFPQCYIT